MIIMMVIIFNGNPFYSYDGYDVLNDYYHDGYYS